MSGAMYRPTRGLVSDIVVTFKRGHLQKDLSPQRTQRGIRLSSLDLCESLTFIFLPVVLAFLCALCGEISFATRTSLQNLQSIKPQKIPIALNRTPARIWMMVKHGQLDLLYGSFVCWR